MTITSLHVFQAIAFICGQAAFGVACYSLGVQSVLRVWDNVLRVWDNAMAQDALRMESLKRSLTSKPTSVIISEKGE